MATISKIRPHLWFDKEAKEARNFMFKSSQIQKSLTPLQSKTHLLEIASR